MRLEELATGVPRTYTVSPRHLEPTVADVTRCACGPSYTPRESVRAAIERTIPVVLQAVSPCATYAVYLVADDRRPQMELSDGREVEIAAAPDAPLPLAVAAALCTVGEVDDRLNAMIESAGPLEAWIAQGVAMAQLDALERDCARRVLSAAEQAGLEASTFAEPAVGSQSQRDLMASVDAESVGVRLTEHGTLAPRLSYTFWVPLHRP